MDTVYDPCVLQPYLLGDSYALHYTLNQADLTDEQIHFTLTVIPAPRAMVGRHKLDPETVHRPVRDDIKAKNVD